jgi:NAD(P)-dependent dehydrogenase (short-subunit alcohol dehydrogenase family)
MVVIGKFMNVLIVGANSGIGQAIQTMEWQRGNKIISTSRNNIDSEKCTAIKIDLNSTREISQAISKMASKLVGGEKIKRVYLCAALTGVGESESEWSVTSNKYEEVMEKYFRVNCISHVSIICGLIAQNLLSRDCVICVLSSIAGSIGLRGKMLHNKPGGNLAYRVSKAALNCSIRNIAYEMNFISPDLVTFMLHPGWVKTKSGGEAAPITPELSAEKILDICDRVSRNNNGEFLDINGIPLLF